MLASIFGINNNLDAVLIFTHLVLLESVLILPWDLVNRTYDLVHVHVLIIVIVAEDVIDAFLVINLLLLLLIRLLVDPPAGSFSLPSQGLSGGYGHSSQRLELVLSSDHSPLHLIDYNLTLTHALPHGIHIRNEILLLNRLLLSVNEILREEHPLQL